MVSGYSQVRLKGEKYLIVLFDLFWVSIIKSKNWIIFSRDLIVPSECIVKSAKNIDVNVC